MELPLAHFSCDTLVVLKLIGSIHFIIHASTTVCFPSLQYLDLDDITFEIASKSSVSFPKLETISLQSVKYANEDSVQQLFSSCPVLDKLFIYGGDWNNVPCLVVHIPSLKRLSLRFLYFGVRKVQINTPALQYLYLENDCKCEYLNTGNFSSLLEATVKISFNIGTMRIDAKIYSITTFKFIEGLFRVKFLSLLGYSLQVIRTASRNIVSGFRNLTQLDIEKHECLDWKVVIKTLLPNMDNLEHLGMKGGKCNGSHESWWVTPLNVPKCLLSRVSNISFTEMYSVCRDELELLRYFLKKAKVLQLLKITSHLASNEKLKLIQKISMFPRGSVTCKVAFT